jgi:hypothetical protein
MQKGILLGCCLFFLVGKIQAASNRYFYAGLESVLRNAHKSDTAKIEACGVDQQDLDAGPRYQWITLSKVNIDAKVTKINGLLCIGTLNEREGFDLINYRDNSGSRKSYKIQELSERKVLVDDTDLDIGIIKEGPIMSIKVIPLTHTQVGQSYLVSFRFLRNLSKLSPGRDIRQMQFEVFKEYSKEQCVLTPQDRPELRFESLGLTINLGLKIEEIHLQSSLVPATTLKTDKFTVVGDLIRE